MIVLQVFCLLVRHRYHRLLHRIASGILTIFILSSMIVTHRKRLLRRTRLYLSFDSHFFGREGSLGRRYLQYVRRLGARIFVQSQVLLRAQMYIMGLQPRYDRLLLLLQRLRIMRSLLHLLLVLVQLLPLAQSSHRLLGSGAINTA